jgi:hypothetical protein
MNNADFAFYSIVSASFIAPVGPLKHQSTGFKARPTRSNNGAIPEEV